MNRRYDTLAYLSVMGTTGIYMFYYELTTVSATMLTER